MADPKPSDDAQNQLFRLLRDAHDGKPDPLRHYLDTSPRAVTDDLLHTVATRATPTHRSWYFWLGLCIFLFAATCIAGDVSGGKGWWDSGRPMMQLLFPTLSFLGSFYKWMYRKGRAALLHLAERDDLRALPLLLAEWQAHPFPTRRAWDDQVADALARLLDEAQQEALPLETQDKLQKIATRLMPPPRFWHRFGRLHGDLSPASAYLAVAVLRRLHETGNPDSRDLLTHIAALPLVPLPPRRAFVRDVVQSLLPIVPTPVVSVPNAAQPTAVAPSTVATTTANVQTLGRS